MQPHDRARRLRQPLERALEIDVRADVDPRLPRLVVELLGLADLIAPNPHQRLRRRDLANPAPEVPVAAILLDVADDFQKRLLHHVFGVLGTPRPGVGQAPRRARPPGRAGATVRQRAAASLVRPALRDALPPADAAPRGGPGGKGLPQPP